MSFSLSFAGVQVRISPSSTSSKSDANNFSVSSVRHCDDGHIEADVCNFSGTIIISGESSIEEHEPNTRIMRCREVIVDAVPEELELDSPLEANNTYKIEHEATFMTASSYVPDDPYVPPISHQNPQVTVEIDSEDDEGNKIQSPDTNDNHGHVRFSPNVDQQIIQESKPKIDLSLHNACASEDAEIDDLRDMLKSKPELASVADEYGDYVAHVFANNDSFIYTSSDYDVQQFAIELYTAYPRAFMEEGYDGQIPFAGTICDWVDDCHQLYARNKVKGDVYRVSEIKTLTKSTRVINSLCVRADVQRLTSLPTQVSLPPKVAYSFKMLSFILDTLGQSAFQDISTRREFWAVASKRRDTIISSVASIPFIVRTILLIENKTERDALIALSIVRNLIFRPESVDLWLVALLSGDERARDCAILYICLISRISLSGLFGRRMDWSGSDSKRFHSMRASLYCEVGKLEGFLPCMLHLGDSLNEVATRRAVKYVVESAIGRPLPVYLMFMEFSLLLLLLTSYRIIVELVYAFPSEEFLSQYRELWGLALSIAVYFASRDIAIMASLSSTEEKLVMRYATGFGNMFGFLTTVSVIVVLSMMYVNSNVEGHNFVGIVAGLLWWKFLLHVKGMSQNLSTLIYTIIQIATALKYFLAIFLIAIFFFADMIDIVKKTSGECNDVDGAMDSSLETFCSLTPLQTYLAMYGVMIGGIEISALEGSSALVSLIFVAASFCGVIVLVNILIAIVTGEYEKARARSCHLFARARLEAAAAQVAREKIVNLPDDPASGLGRKILRHMGKLKILAIIVIVEYFIVKSLISCTTLHKGGVLGDFIYVALLLTAVLYHTFVVGGCLYLGGRAICNYESLRWLRGSKFHRGILKICLVPVCRYLQSVGLGKGASCPDGSDMNEEDRPLSHNVFVGKQADFENSMEEAIKASETRILHAMKFMVVFQIPPE